MAISTTCPVLFLSLLSLSLLLSPSPAYAAATGKCHPDDESALLDFKSAMTADPLGMLNTWKPGTDCCASWNGVSCRVDSRVTELSIYGDPKNPKSFLSGSIPASFSKLQRLTGIYFEDLKNLTGPFPANVLYTLPDLLYVYINNAGLSGPIPADIGRRLPKLAALGLARNRLSGELPQSLSDLTDLIQLDLSYNSFAGVIPAGLKSLRNLNLLRLDGNSFSGALPDLSPLTQLYSLTLSNNKLTGGIPASLASFASQLRYLSLANNLLTGTIPTFLGRFTSLDTLDLSGNRLTGPVSPSFRNLTKIFNLNLSSNALVDPFPEMAVKGIESLDLSDNRFHLGKIPKWAEASPIIYSLKLRGCGIKMRMEEFNPAETYYYDYIDLSGNEITGSPVALLNRTQLLLEFRAAGNKTRFDMGNLKLPSSLKALDMSHNLAYWRLPAGVSGLEKLDVSYNHLCGPIPPTRFPASAFANNDCLCGPPLPPCRPKI